VSLVFQYRMRCLHWCDRLGVQPDGGVRMLQYVAVPYTIPSLV